MHGSLGRNDEIKPGQALTSEPFIVSKTLDQQYTETEQTIWYTGDPSDPATIKELSAEEVSKLQAMNAKDRQEYMEKHGIKAWSSPAVVNEKDPSKAPLAATTEGSWKMDESGKLQRLDIAHLNVIGGIEILLSEGARLTSQATTQFQGARLTNVVNPVVEKTQAPATTLPSIGNNPDLMSLLSGLPAIMPTTPTEFGARLVMSAPMLALAPKIAELNVSDTVSAYLKQAGMTVDEKALGRRLSVLMSQFYDEAGLPRFDETMFFSSVHTAIAKSTNAGKEFVQNAVMIVSQYLFVNGMKRTITAGIGSNDLSVIRLGTMMENKNMAGDVRGAFEALRDSLKGHIAVVVPSDQAAIGSLLESAKVQVIYADSYGELKNKLNLGEKAFHLVVDGTPEGMQMAREHLSATSGKVGVVDKDYALGRGTLYLAIALPTLADKRSVVAVGNFDESQASKDVLQDIQKISKNSGGFRLIRAIWQYLSTMWGNLRTTAVSA